MLVYDRKGRCRSLLFAICYSVEASPLPALRTFTEKLQRMPDVSKSVTFPDGLFDFLHGTRIHHQSNPAALGTNQVVIMLLRVQQLEITTTPVQKDTLRNREL